MFLLILMQITKYFFDDIIGCAVNTRSKNNVRLISANVMNTYQKSFTHCTRKWTPIYEDYDYEH